MRFSNIWSLKKYEAKIQKVLGQRMNVARLLIEKSFVRRE